MNFDSVPANSVCTIKDIGEDAAALEHSDGDSVSIPPTRSSTIPANVEELSHTVLHLGWGDGHGTAWHLLHFRTE